MIQAFSSITDVNSHPTASQEVTIDSLVGNLSTLHDTFRFAIIRELSGTTMEFSNLGSAVYETDDFPSDDLDKHTWTLEKEGFIMRVADKYRPQDLVFDLTMQCRLLIKKMNLFAEDAI